MKELIKKRFYHNNFVELISECEFSFLFEDFKECEKVIKSLKKGNSHCTGFCEYYI